MRSLSVNRVINRYLLIRPLLQTPNVEITGHSRTLLPVREIKACACTSNFDTNFSAHLHSEP